MGMLQIDSDTMLVSYLEYYRYFDRERNSKKARSTALGSLRGLSELFCWVVGFILQ